MRYELHDVTPTESRHPRHIVARLLSNPFPVETKYLSGQVWVLETLHGYYPIGTWGYAAYLGSDESEARAKLAYWEGKAPGDYRLYNNHTGAIVYPE